MNFRMEKSKILSGKLGKFRNLHVIALFDFGRCKDGKFDVKLGQFRIVMKIMIKDGLGEFCLHPSLDK